MNGQIDYNAFNIRTGPPEIFLVTNTTYTATGTGGTSDPFVYTMVFEVDSNFAEIYQVPMPNDTVECWMSPDTEALTIAIEGLVNINTNYIYLASYTTGDPPVPNTLMSSSFYKPI